MKLADGKARTIQHMMVTTFWHPDGTPMSAQQLAPLLRLKYHNAIADAVADLGPPDEIGRAFAGFQKYLYQPGETLIDHAYV